MLDDVMPDMLTVFVSDLPHSLLVPALLVPALCALVLDTFTPDVRSSEPELTNPELTNDERERPAQRCAQAEATAMGWVVFMDRRTSKG